MIEINKERYCETLEESSYQWHKSKHNPWPYINFILFILNSAYKEFKERVGEVKELMGTKTEIVCSVIKQQKAPFTVANIQRQCPG